MNWTAICVRGVAAVVFGILALAWPAISVVTLAILFGVYALVDGIGAIATRRWWWLIAEGIIGILAGIGAFLAPASLGYTIAGWAWLTAILEIGMSFPLRRRNLDDWLMPFAGIVSAILGGILAVTPPVGPTLLSWYVGIYGIVFGALLLGLAMRLRAPARPAARPDIRRAA